MNQRVSALALLIERRRRVAEHAAIGAALQELYEHVPRDRTARVSALQVHRAVAAKVRHHGTNPMFARVVSAAAVEMGAVKIRPGNQRWFVFFRERVRPKPEVAPRRKLSAQELGKLRRKWYARARSGAGAVEDIERPDGNLVRGVSARASDPTWYVTRADLNGAYFQRRKDAYWRLREALDVWALYVVEGEPIRIIEERTGLGRDRVHRTVKLFERWIAAGQPGLFKETSTDEDDDQDRAASTHAAGGDTEALGD